MGITRLLAISALVCAAGFGAAQAQQAGPPPAVLVQAAELKPLGARSEFIGRAAAVDKVDLRARVKGFLGPRKQGLLDQAEVALDPRGNVAANVVDYQTSDPQIFACGDMRRGQSLVVWAIREGRQAARAVDLALVGSTELPR